MQVFTGFHAVEERLRLAASNAGAAQQMQVFYSAPGPRVKKILELAAGLGVKCAEADKKRLDSLVRSLPAASRDHRGIVLQVQGVLARSQNAVDFDEWLDEFSSRGEPSKRTTVLVLDSITDPHNAGAILRSADQFGVSLVIMPSRRSAGDVSESETIARTSAGASSWVKTCTVTNLVRAVKRLKEAGFWVYGADARGEPIRNGIFVENTVLVMGSEGGGIARLLREECDTFVSIPTCGHIDSLNVSVAAGILLCEIYRQGL